MKTIDNVEFNHKEGSIVKIKDFSAKGFSLLFPFSPVSAEQIAEMVMNVKGFLSGARYAHIYSLTESDDYHQINGAFYKDIEGSVIH